jgi:hypothetical protein
VRAVPVSGAVFPRKAFTENTEGFGGFISYEVHRRSSFSRLRLTEDHYRNERQRFPVTLKE